MNKLEDIMYNEKIWIIILFVMIFIVILGVYLVIIAILLWILFILWHQYKIKIPPFDK